MRDASSISIAIATHNRLADLQVTLKQLARYEGEVREIMVCADGCADGTQEFLKQSYPEIRLFENTPGRGSIPSRNRMIRSAAGAFVLLLDDDSYPVEAGFFEMAQTVMEENPDIGVLTFPQRSDEFPESLTAADFGRNEEVGTFTSSGSIIRRELFLKLGGFPDFFFHAYEEPDYSVRVLESGYRIVRWNELTVRHHFTSNMRNEGRTHRRHARNESWSTLMRTPGHLLLLMLPYRCFSQGRYALSRGLGWLVREPLWWGESLRGFPQAWRHRKPVSSDTYRRWIRLMRHSQPFVAKGEAAQA